MRRSLAVLVLLVAAAAAAPSADAQTVNRSRHLWATVNVCDTEERPNRIGIRASMPGSGRREIMYMRFQVQFFSRQTGRWHNIRAEEADSGWVRVGSARYKARQAGWTFEILPPPGGGRHLLRGSVTFEWRARGEVVRRARERTTSGHRTAAGSDPPGYSAATCTIK